MSQNLITKGQLGFFYENRKKLDNAIGQILGPDIHLHDISQQQSQKSYTQKKTITIKRPSNGSPHRKPQKIDDFYTSMTNQNKIEKLYKENIELQKKMMNVKDENQMYKVKSGLWQKIKNFIVDIFDKQYKLKSVKFSSSDGSILDEFLSILQEITIKNKVISSHRNFRVDQGEKDHAICRQLQEDVKKKFQEEAKKVSKLAVEVEVLRNQNKMLRDKEDKFKFERIARISQLQTGIQQKFEQIQKSLHQKTEQNKFLVKKIATLQSQLFQLRNLSSPLRQREKDRTISTTPQTYIDKTQIDFLKQLSKTKDGQINTLKYESKQLQNEVLNLKKTNQKMRTVIQLAQSLNNQFINKLEESVRKNLTKYEHGNSQYQIGRPNFQKKSQENPQQFHFVNQRFKLVKSRSLDKEKYQYGQKLKI